jgi:cell division protein FtsB
MSIKKILRILVTFFLFLFVLSLSRNIWHLVSAGERIEKAKSELFEKKAENAKLLEKKEKLESGDFLEEQARNKLFMAKKNEVVLILPTSATGDGEKEEIDKEFLDEDEKEVWEKWLALFW